MKELPPVTVAVPVLQEEAHLTECLDSIAAQSYPNIVEVLVVDGGSTDATRDIARSRREVTLLDNPRRIQAAALNEALKRAKGDVFVRVDGHCTLAVDYVERCVDALRATRAAAVGGGMMPTAVAWFPRVVGAAMRSPLGAGPARFHIGGTPGWVDTVYLGAFPTQRLRHVGGWAADFAVNEDAELAYRLQAEGGVWFDPAIRSTYSPRASVAALALQFFRYGRGRARTVWRHPASLAPRQLAAPTLVLGVLSRWRRRTLLAYGAVVGVAAAAELRSEPRTAPGMFVVLPIMHAAWGSGFLFGFLEAAISRRTSSHATAAEYTSGKSGALRARRGQHR